uniref:Dehydrogenase/reductase SDR family member 4 n=1 Tax=Chromera velia TaxID=505693 RepID=A0A2K8DNH0_9ALVE|nr:Dehydrogenase/reductase SDR family member 4 [Chromera velia]
MTAHKCRRFEGKLAVVTASTAGIGLAIATRLASEGADVVVSSRKEDAVRKTETELQAKGLSVKGVVCHVDKKGDRERLLQTAVQWKGKKIDVLVSNAASSTSFGTTLDTPEKSWDKMFQTNVKAAFLLVQEALPVLPPGSSVLLVASYLGFQPEAPIGVYGITKTALFGLTKALALELGPSGVRVNCLAPGVVKTNFSRLLWEDESANEAASSRTALKRVGEPDEMGGPAAFLLSEDASYVTGETVVAAGGMQSRL